MYGQRLKQVRLDYFSLYVFSKCYSLHGKNIRKVRLDFFLRDKNSCSMM